MEEHKTDKIWLEEFKKTEDYRTLVSKPVAYFSAEYALSPALPIYAGGLGILAGDMVYEVGSCNFPIVFVGLFYKQGQNNVEATKEIDKDEVVLIEKEGKPLIVNIKIDSKNLAFQVWKWQKDSAVVYLLDTDIDINSLEGRNLTHDLYVEDRESRLRQEILLGIGGRKFLEVMDIHPSAYHLNEGHSAFLALELAHHEMVHQKVDFKTACQYAKNHILFTNHTLVSAGQEIFANYSIIGALNDYAKEINVPIEEIVKLGACEDLELFSMTMFSFRMSSRSNSVSLLHGKVAASVWPDYKMENVTNGIHIPRWDNIKDEDLVDSHKNNKKILLDYIKETTGVDWDNETLLFGWGRRLVPYKQPLAFIEDIERVLKMAQDTNKPFRIVFSGPTNDHSDSELVKELKMIIDEKLKDVAVFLPHYNIKIAKMLVSGCDVWLNTPEIGKEACGTSGMKAGLNGTLSLSTNDGWVAEINLEDHGWVIRESENLNSNLMNKVESEIVPMYYGDKETWISYMKKSRQFIKKEFSMTRALREYTEKFYLPIIKNKHESKFD